MNDTTPEALLARWDAEKNGITPEASTLPHRFEIQIMRTLAEGVPVTPDALAHRLGVPTELVERVLELGRTRGGEWDEEGRLVGSALTLRQTRHEFHIGGRRLYTWCAFDAVYLPALLRATAAVKSTDPGTGATIELTVTPTGVTESSPPGTVISVNMGGLSGRTGPDSPVCAHMNFLKVGVQQKSGWPAGPN